MHLVDYEDDVAERLDLVDEPLHAAFKLSAELGACDECGQVEQMNFLVFQLIRHIAVCNAHGETFGDGGFADTRLTDEARVVFLAAVENLNHALGFAFPADNGIQLTPARARGQIGAVGREVFALFRLLLAAALFVTAAAFAYIRTRRRRVALLRKHFFQEREGVRAPEFKRVIRLLLCTAVSRQRIVILVLAVHFCEGVHIGHFICQLFEVIVRDAHLAHQSVNRLEPQLTGTFEAIALVGGGTLLQLGNKDDCHIFVAAGTKWHMHKGNILSGARRTNRLPA